MTFSAPAILWALPLCLAPLLLHLLSRRRAVEIAFSDLTFLRQVYARALPRTRLRQWLLIVARCLILFCLVLSYAGPVLRAQGEAQGAAAEGLDLVLLLDASYSMGYRELGKTRFEIARSQAEGLVRSLKASDRVSVGIFSDRLESPTGKLAWVSPREALETLARAKLGFRSTDYALALKAASELFSADPRRRVAVLLTDGSRHGLRGPLPALDPGILILGLEWPKGVENASLVWAGPARESNARKPQILARAAGLKSGRVLELSLEGRRLQGSTFKAGAGEQAQAQALPSAKDAASPSWWGTAALRPDELSADDSYFYSFRHPSRPRVLCLYGNPAFFKAPGAGYFLKEILGPAKESLLDYDCDFLELARFGEARLSDYRLAILADFKEVPAAAASELDRFVRRGGGLWVLPGARGDPDGFASLNSWLPAQFGPLAAGEGYGLKVPASELKGWKGFDLGKVAIARYHLLQVRPGSTVHLKSPSGYPLLVSGPRGEGRAAVWASALDTSWSNLAVKPVFPAWVQAILGLLSPSSGRGTEIFEVKVGEPIVRTWGPSEPAPASVRVRAPDGRSTVVWLKDRRIEYPQTAKPGLYALTEEGSGRRLVYAANLDRSAGESDLAPLASPPWRPLRSDSVAADFWLEVYGKDMRGAVLSAAAALLLIEMFLALPRASAVILLAGLLLASPSSAQQGDRFVWSQLELGSQWDPYPAVYGDVLELMSTVTSVLAFPERRVLGLKDRALFSSPLVILAGRQAPPSLDDEELRNLRNYLAAGGTLWIEDVSGTATSSFDRWVRRLLPALVPEAELAPLDPDHVVFKTFFLLRGPAGRVMVRGSLEGVNWAGRTAVIYSRNDLLGAWVKDALGKPLYPCLPGGEAQRHNARKLTVNILMYALTGSYKSDAVHQPFLLQKMRSGVP